MVVVPSATELGTTPVPNPVKSATARPQIGGKFLYVGGEKLYVRGVTYGTFRESVSGPQFPSADVVRRDFAFMTANRINAVRTYTVPPRWVLDIAAEQGLYVMAGMPWEQHITFLDSRQRAADIRARVRSAVRECAQHPALLCYTIGNEIPAPIVRWHGRRPVERFLKSLYETVKTEDPGSLATYVNFPTTEYLELNFLDFMSFNVYLERQGNLTAYLARLHSLAGDRPLVMGEVGLDSRRNGELRQAEVLDWQIRTVFDSGCAGIFLFAWTDEWYRGGFDIEDWDFGLVTRDRKPKPALSAVRSAFTDVPFAPDLRWPRISVVVCSYNGSRTIGQTLQGVTTLPYSNYEVIVVNDGSTDRTAEIARDFDVKLISIDNGGLSNARNVGMRAATGEIVAYCDDDAYPDTHWLHYLAHTYLTTDYAGVGGPNLPPGGDGHIAEAVANAPGGPVHVLLSDTEAEHIPGCNSSYRRSCLLAVGGYDPTFRVAGDDVDLCWRIQQQGWKIGFHPAAVVWHHRRNSVKAYWRQQRGYGKAEALLKRKWPEKYNELGHLPMSGRLYGTGLLRAIGVRWRVYHGVWGSALFQSLYEPAPDFLQMLARTPEWFLVCTGLGFLSLLGLSWTPLFAAIPLFLIAFALLLGQVVAGTSRAVFPSRPTALLVRIKLYLVTVFLYLVQPLARLQGRLSWGLTPWRLARASGFGVPLPSVESIWSERWHSHESWVKDLETFLRGEKAWVSRGGDFDDWDLTVKTGLGGGVRVTSTVEEHGGGKQLLRFRVRPYAARIAAIVTIIIAGMSLCAARSGSHVAASLLGTAASALVVWLVMSCGYAQRSVIKAVRQAAGRVEKSQ